MKIKQNSAIFGLIAVGVVLAILILRLESQTVMNEQEIAHEEKTDPHEDKIELSDQQIEKSGITIRIAGTGNIKSLTTLPGEIHLNEDNTSHIVPRLAGVVEGVFVKLGEQVKKGQLLAVIASSELAEQRSAFLAAQSRLEIARANFAREKALFDADILPKKSLQLAQTTMQEAEIAIRNVQQKLKALGATSTISNDSSSINRYEIRAPFDGILIEKHIALGEAVKEDANIFIISDLSTVWANIIISAKDLSLVKVGEKVTIKATALDSRATGNVTYVGALMGEQTRTAIAYVTLDNPHMAWRPGLFINVEIVANETVVPVAVSSEAVQNVKDKPTIFIRVPGGFVAQPVITGLSNDNVTEIVKGLNPGTEYAVNGSFIIKSEHGKSSAEHSH